MSHGPPARLLLLLSRFSHVRLFATPWTAAHQAPPSMVIIQARTLEWVAIAFVSLSSGRSTSKPQLHRLAVPAQPERGFGTTGGKDRRARGRFPEGRSGPVDLFWSELVCAPRRGRVPRSPPQPSEPRAPAVRARAAPPGPARRQAPGREGPLLGAARSTGACTPSPPPCPRAYTNDGKDTGTFASV